MHIMRPSVPLQPDCQLVPQEQNQNAITSAICPGLNILTHWDRKTYKCVTKPDRRQAIIWTNAQIMLIGPLGMHFLSRKYIWKFPLENGGHSISASIC